MSEAQRTQLTYSVVIPVCARVDDLETLVAEYDQALRASGVRFEFVLVLDGKKPDLTASLLRMSGSMKNLKIVELSREFGESAALTAGFDASSGDMMMTLPAYYQVEPAELVKLLQDDAGEDLLITHRWPRAGSSLETLRRTAFHQLFAFVSGYQYRDLGCGVRLFRREVATEIPLYGDQHRFLPALAVRRGFRVREVDLAQSPKDRFRGRYRLREYLHRFLDVLTIFFLVRFTKKPLRFFGTVGFIAAGVGVIFLVMLVVQRLFFGVELADRPALLLSSLLVVLGVQTFGLGLIGELIIFTHASNMKEYAVRAVIQRGGNTPSQATPPLQGETDVRR